MRVSEWMALQKRREAALQRKRTRLKAPRKALFIAGCLLLLTLMLLPFLPGERNEASVIPRTFAEAPAKAHPAEEPVSLPSENISSELHAFLEAMMLKERDVSIILAENHTRAELAFARALETAFEEQDSARFDELEIGVDALGGRTGEDPAASVIDLPLLLRPRNFSNRIRTGIYTQTLSLPEGTTELARDLSDPAMRPRESLLVPRGNTGYVYRIDFLPALKGMHESGSRIESIEDERLVLLGKECYIVSASHPERFSITLTLLCDGVHGSMLEGRQGLFLLNGKTYRIEVMTSSANASKASFIVNGEITEALDEGETYELADGTSIGVINTLGTRKNTPGAVEFYLGTLFSISDANTSATNASGTVLYAYNLPQVHADIISTLDEGTAPNAAVEISAVILNYTPSDSLHIVGNMSDEVAREEGRREYMLLNGFDVEFLGAFDHGRQDKGTMIDTYAITPSGGKNYKLSFTNRRNQHYDLGVVGCDTTCDTIKFGEFIAGKFRDLVINESEAVDINDQFVLSFEVWGHVFRLDAIDTTNRIITIHDIADNGMSYEISYDKNGTGSFMLDEGIFTFNVSGSQARIDMNGDGAFTSAIQKLRTAANGDWIFDGTNEPSLQFRTNELYESAVKENISISFLQSERRLDINTSGITGSWKSGFNASNPNVASPLWHGADTQVGWTERGMYGWLYDEDTQSSFEIMYPKMQSFGAVEVRGMLKPRLITFDTMIDQPRTDMIIIGCDNAITRRIGADCDKDGFIQHYNTVLGTDRQAVVIAGKNDRVMKSLLELHYERMVNETAAQIQRHIFVESD